MHRGQKSSGALPEKSDNCRTHPQTKRYTIRKGFDFRTNDSFCQHSLIGKANLFWSISIRVCANGGEERLLLSGCELEFPICMTSAPFLCIPT